jgi:hypothetical protein
MKNFIAGILLAISCNMQATEAQIDFCKSYTIDRQAALNFSRLLSETFNSRDYSHGIYAIEESTDNTPENIFHLMTSFVDISECSPNSICTAYIYVKRFLQTTRLEAKYINWKTLLITSLFIAQKYNDDKPLANLDITTLIKKINQTKEPSIDIDEVTLTQFNLLELTLIKTLDYKMHVTCEEHITICLDEALRATLI